MAFFSSNADQVAETVAALSRHGGKVVSEVFDLNHLDDYPTWLSAAAERLDGCDIFVSCASASGSSATGDWDMCFNNYLKGAVIGC